MGRSAEETNKSDKTAIDVLAFSQEAGAVSADPVAFLDRVCELYGLDYAVYASIMPDGQIIGYTNYPEEWVNYYVENEFHNIDPVILTASQSIVPVNWRAIADDYEDSIVFQKAREFGIGSAGFSIPVRGPYGEFAVFSVTKDCSDEEWAEFTTSSIHDFQSIAVYMHDSVLRGHGLFKLLNKKPLSKREAEALQWYARGKTSNDIAVLTGLKPSTVTAYLQSARAKLNALSTAHAAARAISMGAILPD